jgi:hypothetical protein
LEIAPRNRIIRTDEKEMVWPHVKHVAFSQNGDWMATVLFFLLKKLGG